MNDFPKPYIRGFSSKRYLDDLRRLIRDNPDHEIYYARDDEGNGFQRVTYLPSLYMVDGKQVILLN